MATPPDVVVVDHHDSYTWNLVHLIAGVTGTLPAVVEHDECTPADVLAHEYVVLSPGPGHPDEHDWSVLDLGLPVLGVCLGMQGIVTHFGGSVERAVPVHGEVVPIHHDGEGVFSGLPQDFHAVRYHSLEAARLPDGLEATAACPGSREDRPPPLMGVRHVDLPIEGVQFHPESILSEYGAAIVTNFLRGPR